MRSRVAWEFRRHARNSWPLLAWRKRSGTRLCRFAEEVLRGRGFSTLVIWVFAENANAGRFYEAMGYRADGASKILDRGKPLEAIRYRRELGATQSSIPLL